MTGVEILSTQEVATAFGFNWLAFFIATFVLMLVFAFVGWANDPENRVGGWLIGISVGCILAIGLGVILGFATGKPTEYETQYKVTVSDEVSMSDFMEHYKIIDQDGKIYTVRERND